MPTLEPQGSTLLYKLRGPVVKRLNFLKGFSLSSHTYILSYISDCVSRYKGLVTNYGEGGGATKREGGQVKFYPYEKGVGGGKGFSHAEGGGGVHIKFGVVSCSSLKF